MVQQLNPSTVHQPTVPYTHTMLVPRDADWLLISGQVGVDQKGRVATGIRNQIEQTLKNIIACLKANNMARRDLVKLTIYLTDSRFVDDWRVVRKRVIGDQHTPTGTLLIVDGLANPELLVEIEAVPRARRRRRRLSP